VNATGSGAAWARTFGTGRLGELQAVGEAGRIAAAAAGPLPLAVALAGTGSYATGLVALAAVAALCATLSARWHPARSEVGRSRQALLNSLEYLPTFRYRGADQVWDHLPKHPLR